MNIFYKVVDMLIIKEALASSYGIYEVEPTAGTTTLTIFSALMTDEKRLPLSLKNIR